MQKRQWLEICALVAGGGVLGAGAIIASTVVNHFTSTEAFCTSCHSMATLAADPHYQQSAHRTNAAGALATCADCHIRSDNWFIETYTHAVDGITDVVAEYRGNFKDPSIWGARRTELAHRVRDAMRHEDSATCRACHDAAVIRPASEAGRAAHTLLQQGRMTCIDCHFNLVHAPVAPSTSFIRGSGIGREGK
ncbi:MAG: NapC/NirT family cytochrome c [Xanthobacteraceae bacterium]